MQYRIDPKTQNRLSILGFGLMRLPRGITGTDQDKTTAMIKRAVEGGVNYFDTAYSYGGSEVALGRALQATGLREQIFIASKLPHQQCKTYDDFDRIFNEQLARLQTDRIDYYLIHNIANSSGWQRVVDLGIRRWIEAQKASGQIGQIGFSFHGKQDEFLKLLDMYDWDFCQIQYNYLDINYQAGVTGLKAASERGLMTVIMEPLRGGKLATGLPDGVEKAFKAARPEASTASWALRWIWDQAEPTVVLSGMSTTDQLDDNLLTAADGKPGMLGDMERQILDQAIEMIEKGYRIPCTGCNYCMPCPQGVGIPECFKAYNTRMSLGMVAGVMQYMTGIAGTAAKRYSGPGNCIACKACEGKCPQGIAIVDSLAEVKRKMEPFWYRPVVSVVRMMLGG